jgi:hypothetical protein
VTAVWLLDFDGVVNVTRPGWGGAPRRTRLHIDGTGYRITWAPTLVSHIKRIAQSGRAEVRLASTWNDHAALLGQAIRWDLPLAFPPLGPSLSLAAVAEAKVAAALTVVERGARLVWTDDEAIPAAGPVRDALHAAGALLITPSPRRGLQPPDIETIDAYLG